MFFDATRNLFSAWNLAERFGLRRCCAAFGRRSGPFSAKAGERVIAARGSCEKRRSAGALQKLAHRSSRLLALTVEAGLAGLVAVKLVVGQFARVRATPGFGGETAQHARPAAVGGFVAVGMQAGVEIGNRTPDANEGWFRKSFERVSERRVFLETVIPSLAQSNCQSRL